MENQSNKSWREALNRLPDYDPPAGEWSRLSARLSAEGPLHRALRELPEHEPPDAVWTGIEKGLDGGSSIRRIGRYRWMLGVAASLLLLVATWSRWPAGGDSNEATPTYAYHTEVLEDPLLAQLPTDEDEAYFARLLRLCDEQPVSCARPAFEELRAELEELNVAREELEMALGAYGADVDLLQQLKEIELERTKVAQQLLETVA